MGTPEEELPAQELTEEEWEGLIQEGSGTTEERPAEAEPTDEELVEQVAQQTGTHDCNCDPCCGNQNLDPSGPWRVRVTPRNGQDENGYIRPEPYSAALVVAVPVGTVLEVLEQMVVLDPNDGKNKKWYRVATMTAPRMEGWIIASRTERAGGTSYGYPFVLEDGRDGSPMTAVAHAKRIMDGGGTDYASLCLGFVKDCYYISGVEERCPLMAEPGRCRKLRNAFGAFEALDLCDKTINTIPATLPAGAIVFWGKSDTNKHEGHCAIVIEDNQVISSGYTQVDDTGAEVGTPVSIFENVAAVSAWTGAEPLGFTMANLAFTPGTWGTGGQGT